MKFKQQIFIFFERIWKSDEIRNLLFWTSVNSFASFSLSVSFLKGIEIDTITFWKGDQWFFLSDNEDIAFSGSKGFSISILNVDDVETSQMSFNVQDLSSSTNIVSASNVTEMSWLIFNPTFDLVFLDIEFNGVSFSDFWVGESNGSRIVSDNVWDFVWSNSSLFYFQEFVFWFWILELDDGESTLNVVENSVALSGFD